MTNIYALNSKSVGFERLKSWTITVEDETVEWRPEAPFLFALTPKASELIDELYEAYENLRSDSYNQDYFDATPTGPSMILDLSNRHTVLYLVHSCFDIAGSFDPEELDEDFEPRIAKLSRTAPKLVAIFGPQGDEYIY